ncbi:MAG TPA: DUF5665 domain-containing protein [Candidatus Saccharimonas sp.]|jgi:hypothetical protein|nr:DUF5665 domain-containing protein [Candidatus Saccharimonas sp.]
MMKFWQKLKKQVRDDNEKGAREAVLEDLFNDFNRNRFTIYKFNFVRGVFFGFGSVLGGTVVVALVVGLLTWTGQLIPGVAGFVDSVVDMMQRANAQ